MKVVDAGMAEVLALMLRMNPKERPSLKRANILLHRMREPSVVNAVESLEPGLTDQCTLL